MSNSAAGIPRKLSPTPDDQPLQASHNHSSVVESLAGNKTSLDIDNSDLQPAKSRLKPIPPSLSTPTGGREEETPTEPATSRVLKEVDFKRKFDKLPQYDPDNSDRTTPLPMSPLDLIKSCMKRTRLSTEVTAGESDIGVRRMPRGETSAPGHSLRVMEERHFFGSSFNMQSIASGDNEEPLAAPQTPTSPTSSSRQIIDLRRHLVTQLFIEHGWFPSAEVTSAFQMRHQDVFPSRNLLQLKIREVRQRMMAQMAMASPVDRDGPAMGPAAAPGDDG
jgi:hypothetical protein